LTLPAVSGYRLTIGPQGAGQQQTQGGKMDIAAAAAAIAIVIIAVGAYFAQ
jgi:hypothetical protein